MMVTPGSNTTKWQGKSPPVSRRRRWTLPLAGSILRHRVAEPPTPAEDHHRRRRDDEHDREERRVGPRVAKLRRSRAARPVSPRNPPRRDGSVPAARHDARMTDEEQHEAVAAAIDGDRAALASL